MIIFLNLHIEAVKDAIIYLIYFKRILQAQYNGIEQKANKRLQIPFEEVDG